MARYYLSPHRVARYYFHECDRYLRYMATPKAAKEEEGVPPYELDHNLLTKAILDSGYSWEQRVLETYLNDSCVLPAPDPDKPEAPVTDRRHTAVQTLDALKNAVAGHYIYQSTLIAPDGFYERYGLDRDLVALTDCHPDLLMITFARNRPGLEVTVIDLKATNEEKLAHKIQSTLYTLILETVLAGAGLDHLSVSRRGGVWLFEHDEPTLFDLSGVRPPLETFLTHELEPILRAPASEAFWHLYFRCEWCDFYQHCRERAEATDDIDLVPYLSTFAKRHLNNNGVNTIDELDTFLKRDDAEEIMTGVASLRGKKRRLQLSVTALKSGEVSHTGGASVAMPKSEDVRIILSLQSEPLGGHMYGYAINRFGGGPLKKNPSEPYVFDEWRRTIARVSPTNSADHIQALRRNLVRDLIGILRPVHDFNEEHPSEQEWRLRKSVQVYVFDTYERELLVEALLEATHDKDAEIAEAAVDLFFHFQHPDLAAAEDHPANEVFFPVVVLTQVARSLFALPIKIVYRFTDVVAALQPSEYGFDYKHNPYFDFELSNRMKSDALYYVWYKGEVGNIDKIATQLKVRVWAADSVINGIRERLTPTEALFAYPPKFALPPGLGFRHRLLSRLAFVARYEYVLRYLDTRVRRTSPEPERLASADSLRLRYLGGDRYQIDPTQPEIELEKNTFGNWILTHDNEQGRRARLAYDDARYRNKPFVPSRLDMALADIKEDASAGLVRLGLRPSKEFAEPKEGDVVILEQRAADSMTDKLIAELAALDKEDDPWFVRLVNDPVASRGRVDIRTDVRETAMSLASGAGMTPSQLEAFERMVDNNLQLVWGPPGTGKTHFLAAAILCLAEAHRRALLPLKVLLTGFTHAAIDNALRKLLELQVAKEIFREVLPVGKNTTGTSDVVPGMSHEAVTVFAHQNSICVIGSTVWQARKISAGDLRYDLVIVDESSQLEVADAAIPIRRVRPGGRLVIVGDDKQLPPIVQGNYKIPEGEPLIHRSILEALRQQDPDDVTVVTLLENFRMCDVLCEYPRSSIYPATYGPATAEIAARRLPLNDFKSDGLIGQVLEPEHPLVICVMEGVKATAENRREAELVASVAVRLRELLPEGDDAGFWRERLFIVSPHHAQIRAIKRELRKRREWGAEPFVDTVDAMQGQECDVVLVSYGVADVEYALLEKEFIYSRNRLNVAITRARMKTVVFLSRTLLEPPLQALDRDDVAEGIAFMQGLAQSCMRTNGPPVFETAGGSVNLLRAG